MIVNTKLTVCDMLEILCLHLHSKTEIYIMSRLKNGVLVLPTECVLVYDKEELWNISLGTPFDIWLNQTGIMFLLQSEIFV